MITVGDERATLHRIWTLDGHEYSVFIVHGGRPYAFFVAPTVVTLERQQLDDAVVRFLRQTLAGFAFTS